MHRQLFYVIKKRCGCIDFYQLFRTRKDAINEADEIKWFCAKDWEASTGIVLRIGEIKRVFIKVSTKPIS